MHASMLVSVILTSTSHHPTCSLPASRRSAPRPVPVISVSTLPATVTSPSCHQISVCPARVARVPSFIPNLARPQRCENRCNRRRIAAPGRRAPPSHLPSVNDVCQMNSAAAPQPLPPARPNAIGYGVSIYVSRAALRRPRPPDALSRLTPSTPSAPGLPACLPHASCHIADDDALCCR